MAAGRALPEATDSSQKSTCSVYTKRKVKLDQKALHTDVHPYAQSFSLSHTHNKQTNKHNTHTRTHNRSHVGTQPQTHRHTHKLNCTTTRALASFRSRQLLSLFFSSFFPSSFVFKYFRDQRPYTESKSVLPLCQLVHKPALGTTCHCCCCRRHCHARRRRLSCLRPLVSE